MTDGLVDSMTFIESRKAVLNYVISTGTVIGVFDYAVTPDGSTRCLADCKWTANGWRGLPLCKSVTKTRDSFVRHLYDVHIGTPRGKRDMKKWAHGTPYLDSFRKPTLTPFRCARKSGRGRKGRSSCDASFKHSTGGGSI